MSDLLEALATHPACDVLRKADLDDFLSRNQRALLFFSGDVVQRGKPHPEPYLTAAAALGVRADRCVAIEDSPTGVRSAVAAGVPTLAVPHVVSVPEMAGAVHLDSLAGLTPSGGE